MKEPKRWKKLSLPGHFWGNTEIDEKV